MKVFSTTSLITLARIVLTVAGSLFLAFESYELLSDNNLTFPWWCYVLACVLIALIYWLIDGFLFDGYMRGKAVVESFKPDGRVEVQFGELFAQDGWLAIGVNDFFDSQVDERVISTNTLHGKVLVDHWGERRPDWDAAVAEELARTTYQREVRQIGKVDRYPIGAAAAVVAPAGRKFVFVALGRTSSDDGVTKANAEDVICAVRGMLRKARQVCANEPLNIPLLGSGLARTGIREQLLLQLILIAIHEECRAARVTSIIRVVLPKSLADKFNLGAVRTHWK